MSPLVICYILAVAGVLFTLYVYICLFRAVKYYSQVNANIAYVLQKMIEELGVKSVKVQIVDKGGNDENPER